MENVASTSEWISGHWVCFVFRYNWTFCSDVIYSCGNGLLTHILVSEGYEGFGIDLRARTSWAHYPEATQQALRVHAFDPTACEVDTTYFPPGAFIIGNHADELTPWVPVLSTLHQSSGYISIPCCSWAFDAKYERSSTATYPMPASDFVESLNLGGEGSNKSSYSMYRIWLATLSVHCGWEVESETLRIPSTRNWAIIGTSVLLSYDIHFNVSGIGRRRLPSTEQYVQNVKEIVEGVVSRGLFKTRKPEGKAGEH